jgi:hypothetical protein
VPNVFQVVINQGDTAAIAMTRNSNSVYRIVKLNANQYPTAAIADAAIGRNRLPAARRSGLLRRPGSRQLRPSERCLLLARWLDRLTS